MKLEHHRCSPRLARAAVAEFTSLASVRLPLVIVGVALLVGCRSAHDTGDTSSSIVESLERQLTTEEAQRIVLSYFDSAIQAAQARSATNAVSRDEIRILTRHRQRSVSRLESFLSHKRSGDELWTYLTAKPRCRESGLALVRGGQVVQSMGILIYD